MLPDREPEAEAEKRELAPDSFEPEATEIFDDLDGVGDAEFRSTQTKEDTEGQEEQLDNDDYDDDPGEILVGAMTPEEEVLEVLRSEAAFSSARAKPDEAVPEALDSSTNAADVEEEAEDEPEDLSAFLDALSDSPEAEAEEYIESEADEEFDPLGDLAAIRSQLSEIQEAADSPAEDEPEYEAVLPTDDPEEDVSEVKPQANPLEAAPEVDIYADPESGLDDDGDPEVDDSEAEEPRRAYRADSDWLDEDADEGFEDESGEVDDFGDDEPEEPAVGSAIPAAAALGALRPRPSANQQVRTRPVTSVREALERDAEELSDIAEDAPSEPVELPSRPRRSKTSDPTERPGPAASRKELLPDVDELDSTLRSEGAQPNRSLETVGEEEKTADSGGFRRAFIWTLFLVALLAVLYLYRPQIVEIVPAAAAVLDPFASFVDGLRNSVDEIVA